MTKRQKFLVTSLLLSFGFIFINFFGDIPRLSGIVALSVFTIILFFWSLKEGLGLNYTLLSLILPFFYTFGVGLFWFLIPSNIYARVPVILIYGIGIYSLCLTMNIYTVSAIRTIALLRSAKGVGFVLTLFTYFLIFDAILSLREVPFATIALVAGTSFPLFYQGYWSVNLDKNFNIDLLKMSLISSLIMAEVSMIMYFWPITVVVGSLFFTIAVYMLLGLGQAKIEGRLFKQTIREYLLLGILVFIGMFISTRWGG